MAGLYDMETGKMIGAGNQSALDDGFVQDVYKDTAPVTTDSTGGEASEQTKRGTGWSRVSRTTPQALAALNSLMAQLQSGGSDENKFFTNAREEEVGRARSLQGQFSPEAARTAGTSLISKSISDALAQLMPGITAASEGSGTSKGSMRALLTQKAGERGAIEGAALAANLGSAYGGIQANLEATLNDLTKQDPNSPLSHLAQLIIGTKGIVENTDSFQTDTSKGSGTKTGQQTVGRQQEYGRTVKTPLGQPMQQEQRGGGVTPARAAGTGYISRTGGAEQPQLDFTADYGYGENYGWGAGDFETGPYAGNNGSALDTGGDDFNTTYEGLTSSSESDIYGGGEDTGGYYEEEY